MLITHSNPNATYLVMLPWNSSPGFGYDASEPYLMPAGCNVDEVFADIFEGYDPVIYDGPNPACIKQSLTDRDRWAITQRLLENAQVKLYHNTETYYENLGLYTPLGGLTFSGDVILAVPHSVLYEACDGDFTRLIKPAQ